MAMFDFLDGYGPTGRGLVQLEANDGDAYDDPRVGPPRSLSFVDPGEPPLEPPLRPGRAATVGSGFVVSSEPSGDEHELVIE